MRIISNFHDYYDSVQVYGQDKSVIYPRKTENIFIDYTDPMYQFVNKIRIAHSAIINVVIVVDTAYLFYSVEDKDRKLITLKLKAPEELDEHFKDSKKYNKGSLLDWNNDYNFSKKGIAGAVEELSKINVFDLCLLYETPILKYQSRYHSISTKECEKNSCLKDFNIQKWLDPYQCFQKIDQFYYGVLARPENKMVVISDKIRLEKHSMDKWSFRKKVR